MKTTKTQRLVLRALSVQLDKYNEPTWAEPQHVLDAARKIDAGTEITPRGIFTSLNSLVRAGAAERIDGENGPLTGRRFRISRAGRDYLARYLESRRPA